MLATKPLLTGSATVAKIIGMLRVCFNSAAVVGEFDDRIKSGFELTNALRVTPDFVDIGSRPADVEHKILSFDPSEPRQFASERRDARLRFRFTFGIGHQHADPSNRTHLLRAGGERPEAQPFRSKVS
jgi:hypothetical protein